MTCHQCAEPAPPIRKGRAHTFCSRTCSNVFRRVPAAQQKYRRDMWMLSNKRKWQWSIGVLKQAFGGCVDCGYNAHPHALDFDHIRGSEKLFAVSQMQGYPWHVVLEEMSKCEVVCANCHRVRTAQRRGKHMFSPTVALTEAQGDNSLSEPPVQDTSSVLRSERRLDPFGRTSRCGGI